MEYVKFVEGDGVSLSVGNGEGRCKVRWVGSSFEALVGVGEEDQAFQDVPVGYRSRCYKFWGRQVFSPKLSSLAVLLLFEGVGFPFLCPNVHFFRRVPAEVSICKGGFWREQGEVRYWGRTRPFWSIFPVVPESLKRTHWSVGGGSRRMISLKLRFGWLCLRAVSLSMMACHSGCEVMPSRRSWKSCWRVGAGSLSAAACAHRSL